MESLGSVGPYAAGLQGADAMTRTSTTGVKVLDKTFDILEAIGESDRGRSLTDLAVELGLPTATVFNLLQHLVRRDYVEKDPTSKLYYLGLRVIVLRRGAIRALQLAARAHPFLVELMSAAHCLSHMAVYRSGRIVYIDRVSLPGTVVEPAPLSDRLPAHGTALGKAILASLPEAELTAYLESASLVRRTPYTIVGADLLREHLRTVRERGYALDRQEATVGVWCVAAPVRDYTGRTIAGVSVSMREEPSAQRCADLAQMVMDTALKISREVGYRPHLADPVLGVHVD